MKPLKMDAELITKNWRFAFYQKHFQHILVAENVSLENLETDFIQLTVYADGQGYVAARTDEGWTFGKPFEFTDASLDWVLMRCREQAAAQTRLLSIKGS